MSDTDVKSNSWTIDKTINLPFLGTVFMAVLSGAVWASTVNARMTRVEEQVAPLAEMQVQVATINERSVSVGASLSRLERHMERIEERQVQE